MSYKATTTMGVRLEERLEPWMTEDLARLCDAWGTMFQPILEVAEESGEDGTAGYVPAWGKLFDPNVVPNKDIAYLMQYVGVERPKEATEAEARMLLKGEAGLERGTLSSIKMAIERIIGKTEPYTIQERTNKAGSEEAYAFNVILKTGKGTPALRTAIEEVVPAGIFFSLIEVENAWIEGGKKWSEVTAGKKWSNIKEGEYLYEEPPDRWDPWRGA